MTFTIHQLRELLPTGDGAELTDSNAGTSFRQLGYDSLALLEFSARLLRQYGDRIPEDGLWQLDTPQETVDYVNSLRSEEAKR